MSELNVGSLFSTVEMTTVSFDRGYARVDAALMKLEARFQAVAGGSVSLDRGLTDVGLAADKAGAGLTRAERAAAKQAASDTKAADASVRLASAQTRVATVMNDVATSSARVQQATLRETAAKERLTAASAGAGTAEGRQAAETARLASAQAGAIGATERLGAAQTTMAARAGAAGKTINTHLGLPLLVAAGFAIKSAMSFEQATNVYVTAAGESQKNLAVVRDGIKQIAVETGTSIKNLTDAEYLAEKAHLRGAAGIQVLGAAAKGAREENANLADVMQAMTSIMASYHIPASRAVSVMNALKTGAGSAKVTMEDYSKALSTVIPIASAAGVGLDQVLGAYSTLTQHGTAAAEATQELAFTIRNLQAPNNVAVSAMNQLGIASVDVSKNLGKRGLTGTLEYIESKLPKTGLVYLTTMKQMEAGTADLTAMQAKMSPELLKASQGFLDGSVTAKKYTADIKGMGASGYAQGLQFKALADKVLGYNDSLKAGTPAQKTMAAELKAIFGGAVGLNTALQLGGHNLEGFKVRTDAVGASLHDTTGQVEGWASTQKLASVQADIAKEKLHVLGIEAGTYLLPMFNKLVGGVTSAVTWFGNLSGTDKELIGWSLVIVAALGPILSIGSRIGLAAGGLAKFAGASTATAATVASSMQKITGALVGAGLAYAGIQKGGQSGGIMAALGGGLTGASIGSFFGPVGTALGGLTGAVVGMGLAYANSGDQGQSAGQKQAEAAQRAKQAIQDQRAAVDALTTSIQNDSNAIGANSRAQVNSDLQKSGALGLAQGLNINPALVTSAALGDRPSIRRLAADIQNLTTKNNSLVGSNGGVLTSVTKLNAKLEAEGIVMGKAGASADLNKEGLGKLSFATRTLSDQTARYGAVLPTTTTAVANQSVAMRANVKYIGDHVSALNADRSAGKLTNVQWAEQIGTLQATMKQYGFNSQAVATYTAEFSHIPKSVITQLLANPLIANSAIGDVLRNIGKVPKVHSTKLVASDGVTPKISQIGNILNNLTGKTIPIYADTSNAISSLRDLQNQINRLAGGSGGVSINNARRLSGSAAGSASWGPGGKLPPGLSTVGERGWELASTDASGRTEIVSHPAAMAFTGLPSVLPGYAAGTVPSFPTVSPQAPHAMAVGQMSMSGDADAMDRRAMLVELATISRKLDHLPQVGPDVSDALNGVTRRAAAAGRTNPAGRRF